MGFLKRFLEPSTYAGLAVILSVMLPGTEEQWLQLLGTVGASVLAAIAIFAPEGK